MTLIQVIHRAGQQSSTSGIDNYP